MSDAVTPLDQVRVLVTGGTSGLGRAMVEALVDAGAHVVLTGRDATRARSIAHEVGATAHGIAMDVRDPDAVEAGVGLADEMLGGLDVLVANAGIGMRTVNPRFLTDPSPFWTVTPEGFEDVVATKVRGTFLVARAVVPRMLAAGSGRVVVVSMNEETMVRRGFTPYGPAGAGVEALARVMVADLADSPVRVNILLPGGATATGMIPEEASEDVRRRLLDPSIMGPPIVWLAAPGTDVHGERVVATEFVARGPAPR